MRPNEWLFLSGLITLGTMSAQQAIATEYLSVPQAQKLLFPQATSFRATLIAINEEQRKAIKNASPTRTPLPEHGIWQVFEHDTPLGWFIIDEVFGKHEYITYATALSLDGKVLGLEVTQYRETKGYEVREKKWLAQFIGKKLDAPLKLEKDIQNISGATLSCLHIAEGVKRLLALHALVLTTTVTHAS